ncbi:MAG: Hsp70 family protein [Cetobacterium sp.]
MAKIIGIDLGTTTSGVSIYQNGKVQIIPSPDGENLIDSVITVNQYGEIVVGREAKNDFGNHIKEIKRRMGKSYLVTSREKEFVPEEVSAEIIKYIKEYAESYLGETIEEAIITVPAMFDSFQKMATIKAGELAGLKVERIVNEPTAAALAYGLDKMENEEKILVYDFGGGTFDVSILDFDMGIMDVIGGDGDNYLGGKNIDELLMMYLANEHKINYKNDIIKENIFKNAVENAKIDLSSNDTAKIIVPELNLSTELTREKFEDLISDIVDKSLSCIDKALEAAKISANDLKVVLPVGGTTKIPYIQKRLREKFGNKLHFFGNPQETVAMGAGIQGAIKSGEIPSETGIILTDICAHNLGISCNGEHKGMVMPGVFSPILKKHTSIPASNEEIYFTMIDNQSEVKIQIYEGSASLVVENLYIGEMTVNNIPPLKAGEGKIKIGFEYDLNGILRVKATVENTGQVTPGEFEMHQKNSVENREKKLSYKSSIYYSDFKTTLDIAEKKMEKASETDKIKIKSLVDQMKQELLNENKKFLDKIDDALTDILFEV